jgi:hypothetical protein
MLFRAFRRNFSIFNRAVYGNAAISLMGCNFKRKIILFESSKRV